MARPRVACDGDSPCVWTAAANLLSKHLADNRQRLVLQLGVWAWG